MYDSAFMLIGAIW